MTNAYGPGRQRNASTGTETAVYRYDELPNLPIDGRWFVACHDHGAAHWFRTRERADQAAHHPETFCPECRSETDQAARYFLRVQKHGGRRFTYSVVENLRFMGIPRFEIVVSRLNRDAAVFILDDLRERSGRSERYS